jgi:hypothetical protein
MIFSELATQSEGYRVEVSGGNENQAFFVEKSDLGWDGEAGNHSIRLQRMRPDGSSFVRCNPRPSAGALSLPMRG